MKAKVKPALKGKLLIVPAAVLISLLTVVAGTKYEKEIKQILNQPTVNQTSTNVKVLPKDGIVKRVIDGDTIELEDGTSVKLVGVNTSEPKDPYYDEAKKFTEKLVNGKKVTFQYDAYTSDRFGRVLAYVIIGDNNLSIELAKNGLAKVAIYEDRRKLIYQDQLLQAQEEAKLKKLGVWKK